MPIPILPNEVIEIILGNVLDEPTITSLCRLSKEWTPFARRKLYSQLELHAGRTYKLLPSLRSNSELGHLTRQLLWTDDDDLPPDARDPDELSNVLEHCPNLTDFSLNLEDLSDIHHADGYLLEVYNIIRSGARREPIRRLELRGEFSIDTRFALLGALGDIQHLTMDPMEPTIKLPQLCTQSLRLLAPCLQTELAYLTTTSRSTLVELAVTPEGPLNLLPLVALGTLRLNIDASEDEEAMVAASNSTTPTPPVGALAHAIATLQTCPSLFHLTLHDDQLSLFGRALTTSHLLHSLPPTLLTLNLEDLNALEPDSVLEFLNSGPCTTLRRLSLHRDTGSDDIAKLCVEKGIRLDWERRRWRRVVVGTEMIRNAFLLP